MGSWLRIRVWILPLVSCSVLASCGGTPDRAPVIAEPVAVILTGGNVFTADPAEPWEEAIVVRDGRIAFVGSSADALALRNAGDKHHDLVGKLVLPGFVDAHTHPGMMAFLGEDSSEELIPKTSHADLLTWLRDYSGWLWPPMIQAGDWPTALYGIEGPHKEELDRVVRFRPVILFDDSGHSQWLNSSALSLLGIKASTPDPAPGLSYFVRDENGEPTGWVKEFALVPFMGDKLLPSRKEMKARLAAFLQFLSHYGVTTLFDAGNLIFHDEVYSLVAELESEGLLPLRYYGSIHITFPNQLDSAVAELKRLRHEYGGERLRFETIKIHFDGVAEIRTAAMLEPYLGENAARGETLVDVDRLRDFILELHDEKIDLHLHTSGDRATRTALDAVEQARARTGGELACSVSLAHIEILADEDAPRFAKLGVAANFTPHWYGGYFKGASLTIGERADRLHRVRTLLDSGAVVSFSSDVTVYSEMSRANPFFGIQTAHNRQEVAEGVGAQVLPPENERVDLESLVRGYTLGGAQQLGIADEVGSIRDGMRADLVIVDRDLFSVDRYEVHSAEPVAVMMDGVVVSGRLD